MNLILLFDDDFTSADEVRLTGRRLEHVSSVHRAAAGDELTVGVAGGRIGKGLVTRIDAEALEMRVTLDRDPPPPLPLTLVLALPRPKVLNRVLAGATSLGVKRIYLINAWRVEKSYWKSPKLSEDNLLLQRILGLEQARDTILPAIELRRFFRPFVEDELPAIAKDSLALVAHPHATEECPRNLGPSPGASRHPLPARRGEGHSAGVAARALLPAARGEGARRADEGTPTTCTLAIGPEGGFIAEEIASLERAGFAPVTLGARILRVETAVAALIGRLY